MSVTITFEPSGISGVVASGTYLVDAAHRLGVRLGNTCVRGKTDHECVVTIKQGTELLSQRTSLEQSILADSGFDPSARLACQVKIENPGELVVNVTTQRIGATVPPGTDVDLRKRFMGLSLNQKIATLLQLEAITMQEAIDAAIEKPLSFGARALDAVIARGRATTQNADSQENSK